MKKSLVFPTLALACLLCIATSSLLANAAIPGEPVNCPANPQAVETLCNGIDDSCSGRIDELDPVSANSCSTGLKGACATGYAQCHPVTGAKVCNGPKPQPETLDGIDNDCDGVVDNVPAITQAVVSKVALFRATGIAPISTNTYEMALDQRGIAYDLLNGNAAIDAVINNLRASYSLVLIPGGVASSFFTAARVAALESFVSAGGVVFNFLPDGGAASNAFGGLSSSTSRTDISYIRFNANAQAPIMASLDTVEELNLYVNGFTSGEGAIARFLRVFTVSSATALANAFSGATGSTQQGVAIARRTLGQGAIYSFGHDMYWYVSYRCYINCFDPSVDVLGLIIRDGLAEGAKGHSVIKHTVPGFQESIVFMTTDTHDYSDTVTGMVNTVNQISPRPRISFFSVTHTDQLAPSVIANMCSLGQCPVGGHTVSHPVGFKSIPTGTGSESIASGYKGTLDQTAPGTNLNGEIRVNQEIIFRATGQKMRIFRSPWLELHNNEFPLLEQLGVIATSCLALGDLKSNLPVDLRKYELLQGIFQYANIYEFPLAGEDGVVDSNKVRYDLQPLNYKWFLGRWKYIQLQNKRNNAMTVILDHDGWGAGPRNEAIVNAKKQAMVDAFNFAKANDLKYNMGIEQYTDWWKGRNNVKVDASFSTATGYRGTLTSGDIATEGLTLQFGDKITSFTCASCGGFSISGNRVLINSFRANLVATFSASVGNTPSTPPPENPTDPQQPPPSNGGGNCNPVVVNDFTSGIITINNLGLAMSDDGTMASSSITDGRLNLNAKAGAYWYTLLTSGNTCFDGSAYSAVTLSVKAPAGAQITLQLQTKDAACSGRSTSFSIQLASYASGGFSPSTARIITIPFTDIPGFTPAKLHAIAIVSILPDTASISVDDIGFVKWNCGGTSNPPPTSPTCSALTVDNFSDGEYFVNLLGLSSSDDGSMTSLAVSGGRLVLTPKAGAYYYTLLANEGQCRNLGSNTGISFSVNAPAGTSMTLELQARGTNCVGRGTTSSVTLSGTTYFNGSTKVVTIPFSSFSPAVDKTKLFAIAISNISGTTSSFSLDDIQFVC